MKTPLFSSDSIVAFEQITVSWVKTPSAKVISSCVSESTEREHWPEMSQNTYMPNIRRSCIGMFYKKEFLKISVIVKKTWFFKSSYIAQIKYF